MVQGPIDEGPHFVLELFVVRCPRGLLLCLAHRLLHVGLDSAGFNRPSADECLVIEVLTVAIENRAAIRSGPTQLRVDSRPAMHGGLEPARELSKYGEAGPHIVAALGVVG